MKNLLLIIGASALLISCKTSFRISVKEPAVIDIPSDALSFGVVNHVDELNSPEAIAGTIFSGQSVKGNKLAAERMVEGVHRGVENSNELSSITLTADSMRLDNGEINWPYLDSLAKKHNVDGFIEIAELRTVAPKGGSIVANMEGNSSTRIDGTAYMNFYIIKDHFVRERMIVRKSYRIRTSGSTSLLDMVNDVQRTREYYRALGFELGRKAGNMLYPNWVWVNRKYYNKGSKELKRAKPMIHKGNWDIAEKQLEYALEGSAKARGRAHFNLALVNEGQGELEEAIKHAEIAALEYGVKMANDYLVTLRQRQRKLEIIDQQESD
jgi:catechol 2,3-dioxygenase-like lactoylglutathione lyase family enzyme